MKPYSDLLDDLQQRNTVFQSKYKQELLKHAREQTPSIAILTCADSRVIPEYIFQQEIGGEFVVRVAGNVAVDPTVLTSLEYAVDHLKVPFLMILGHTGCGAIKATEETTDTDNTLFNEIKQSFSLDETDHIKANVLRQLTMIPQRSKIIKNAIDEQKLTLLGAIYDLESGKVALI